MNAKKSLSPEEKHVLELQKRMAAVEKIAKLPTDVLERLAKLSDRPVVTLRQMDGWTGVEPDCVFTPDEDGDDFFYSVTKEFRRSPSDLAVRIYVPMDASPEAVKRLLTKMSFAEDIDRFFEVTSDPRYQENR